MANIKKDPKKVRLLGKGTGWDQCPDNDEFEVWGLNGLLFSHKKLDRIFMMDVLDEMPSVVSGMWELDKVIERANELKIPLVAPMRYEEIPTAEAFPIKEAAREFGKPYFNNTIAYMICYALLKGVKEIQFYGINQAGGTEYFYEKGCVEYWIGLATGMGVAISIHGKHSELLINKARHGGSILYGYNVTYDQLDRTERKFGETIVKKLLEPKKDNVVYQLGPENGAKLRTSDVLGVRKIWSQFNQHPEARWILSLDDCFNVARLVSDEKPKRILDLGSGIGCSTAVLKFAAEEDVEVVSVEQYDKCIQISKDMVDGIDVHQSDVEIFEHESMKYEFLCGYKNIPEGKWDMVVIDGPGDFMHEGDLVRAASGDIFRIIDDINPGGTVYIDGRPETTHLVNRYMPRFFKLLHQTAAFSVFERTELPYNKKLVVDELKATFVKNKYFDKQ